MSNFKQLHDTDEWCLRQLTALVHLADIRGPRDATKQDVLAGNVRMRGLQRGTKRDPRAGATSKTVATWEY